MKAAQFNFIGMIVSDMAKTLAFYRALGLDIPADQDNEQHAEITLDNGLRLGWDTTELIEGFDKNFHLTPDADWHPRMGLAFLCDSPADVDAHYKQIIEMGYESHTEPWDAFWGQRYAQIKDPDGRIVDLFANLPE